MIRVAGWVLKGLLRHNIQAWRHAALALHDWGLTPLVICLVGVIVIQKVHMFSKLSLCSLSVANLFCVVTTVVLIF
jgi:hypothetical protein